MRSLPADRRVSSIWAQLGEAFTDLGDHRLAAEAMSTAMRAAGLPGRPAAPETRLVSRMVDLPTPHASDENRTRVVDPAAPDLFDDADLSDPAGADAP